MLIEDYVQTSKDFVSFGEETLSTFNFMQWLNNSDFEIDDSNIKIYPQATQSQIIFLQSQEVKPHWFYKKNVKRKAKKDKTNFEATKNAIMR